MADEVVALRLSIGHEKLPDPGRYDPLMLLKVRRQFASATESDVASFQAALEAVRTAVDLDMDEAMAALEKIDVGHQTGNSAEDLRLTLAGYRLVELITSNALESGKDAADWIRRNLKS
jgi:hypothetical protein